MDIADLCLQLTESAGQREQFLRLQNAQHPESSRLYGEGVALFANHDLIKAQVATVQGNRGEARRLCPLARGDAAQLGFAPQIRAADIAMQQLDKL